jgi:NTE family protein/lysophospholipid hydrolase
MSVESKNADLLTKVRTTQLFQKVDKSVLQNVFTHLDEVVLETGESLFLKDDPVDAMYVVIRGRLEARVARENGTEVIVGKIDQGMPAGEIQAFIGGRRTASVYALCKTELVKIPKSAVARLLSEAPEAIAEIADIIRRRFRSDQLRTILPDLFGPLDEKTIHDIETKIEWVHLRRGQILCRQGECGDSLYIVVSGRLEVAKNDEDGSEYTTGEVGRGEIVGEIAILTGGDRSATLSARRDTYLVKISKPAFEQLAKEHPKIIMRTAQTLARRLIRIESQRSVTRTQLNVALLTACPDVPLPGFARRLATALSAYGSTLHLNSQRLDSIMGMSGAAQISDNDPFNGRLAAWFDEQETRHHSLVYEADRSTTAWTRRCLREADRVLIIVSGEAQSTGAQADAAALLESEGVTSASRILVCVHPEGSRLPSGTRKWLSLFQVSRHQHIRWDKDADFDRLARLLTENAIGLVLSGGGAGGFAHIGVIRALDEIGVPLDMVGGTSIGGIIAAQYAMGMEYSDLVRTNRRIWVDSKPLRDFTLPLVSFLSCRRFDRVAKEIYGETQIEDLWINFFCISANLTTAATVVHEHGPLWKTMRATGSLPGLAPPVVQESSLLVDGGIMNNLPVDVMRNRQVGTVIAVDVTAAKELSLQRDRFPSSWELLWSRVAPHKKTIPAPKLFSILMRSALVSSTHKSEEAKRDADLYLTPPVDRFRLLEFSALDEIVDIGYQYAKEKIQEWKGTQLVDHQKDPPRV